MKVSECRLLASLVRESFADFVREFWSTVIPEPLLWNWHIDLLCSDLQGICERIFAGREKLWDWACNISPGSSKSSVFSVFLPAWAWTRMPSFAYIGASYAYPLALDLARRNRDVVKSELYATCFPEIQLRPDQDTKGYFANTRGGSRYAVGAGGTVLGMHGHFIGIDDPLDPNRAASEAELAGINGWIRDTLASRKKDKRVSVIGIIQQRLHQDDPTAQMVAGGGVRHLRVPATTEFKIEPPELADYYVDGLMDPNRLPRAVLDEERRRLGEYGYAGQYGQDPVPVGGGTFKTDRLRWGVPPGRYKRIVRFWDKASTAGGTTRASRRSAFTVGVLMAEDAEGRYWVLDVQRDRLDSYARETLISKTAHRDTKNVIVGVEEEGAGSGIDSALGTIKRLKGFRVIRLRARQNKEIRADEFSVQVNAANVWLPRVFRRGGTWTGWAREYVDELRHWPFSTYRDQGDASGGAFTVLARGRVRVGPLPKPRPGSAGLTPTVPRRYRRAVGRT